MSSDFGSTKFSSAAFLQQNWGIRLYQDLRCKWYSRVNEHLFNNNYLDKCVMVLSFCLSG
jgi:hypothetical protein